MPVYIGLTYSVFMGWDDVMLQSDTYQNYICLDGKGGCTNVCAHVCTKFKHIVNVLRYPFL